MEQKRNRSCCSVMEHTRRPVDGPSGWAAEQQHNRENLVRKTADNSTWSSSSDRKGWPGHQAARRYYPKPCCCRHLHSTHQPMAHSIAALFFMTLHGFTPIGRHGDVGGGGRRPNKSPSHPDAAARCFLATKRNN